MEINIGEKKLNIRKWKLKDRKALQEAIRTNPNLTPENVADILVYSCIEESGVVLSKDEARYVITKIREMSIGDDYEVDFYCEKCGTDHTQTFKLSETVRSEYSPLKNIEVPGVSIKLGPIRNKSVYYQMVFEDELYDFLLKIKEINGNDAFTLTQLEEMFDEMDVDTLEQIMEIYETHKFRIDDVNPVACPNCGNVERFHFNDIPGFFPDSWTK